MAHLDDSRAAPDIVAEYGHAVIAEAVLIVVAYWFGILRNEAVGGTSTL